VVHHLLLLKTGNEIIFISKPFKSAVTGHAKSDRCRSACRVAKFLCTRLVDF
jgi:hypothetical protein